MSEDLKNNKINKEPKNKKQPPYKGGSFGNFDLDTKIDLIEQELKKAQQTFEQLHVMKQQMEEEKKQNELAQLEEKKSSENLNLLKQENDNLKEQLSIYEEEIHSLKKIVSSLKENLTESAQLFQNKVENSLKLLEVANKDMSPLSVEKGDFQASPKNNSQEKTLAEKIAETKKLFAEKQEKANDDMPEINIAKPIEAEISGLNSKQETESLPRIGPWAETTEASENSNQEDQPHTITKSSAEIPSNQNSEPANINEATTEDFSEYEKIKKELEELEKSNIELSVVENKGQENPITNQDQTSKLSPEQKDNLIKEFAPENQATPNTIPEEKRNANENGDNKEKKSLIKTPIKVLITIIKLPFIPLIALKNKLKKTDKKPEENKKNDHHDLPTTKGGIPFVKTAAMLMVIFLGGLVYQLKNAEQTKETYIAQVKGVRTSNQKAPKNPYGLDETNLSLKYQESFAQIPFDKTVWNLYKDSEFGVQLIYPQNTSNRIKQMGGNNLWFLRNNGYLLRIERIETAETLESFFAGQSNDIKYRIEQASIKGVPAIHMVLENNLAVRGNNYLVKKGAYVYKVWYKTFNADENIDDEKRVEQMIGSLEFIGS